MAIAKNALQNTVKASLILEKLGSNVKVEQIYQFNRTIKYLQEVELPIEIHHLTEPEDFKVNKKSQSITQPGL